VPLNLKSPTVLPYFTAGWPDPERFLAAVEGAARAGCTAFEVGLPFSDPVADGPVIQRTSAQALAQGVDWKRALELTGQACQRSGLPAIAMTYANLLYSQGLPEAMQALAAAGCQALIVPDLTLEEGEPFEQAAQAQGLDLVYLAAPTTPDQRLHLLGQRSRGFLYLVSLRGVTGARAQLPQELDALVERVVAQVDLPVLVGFGISRPEQVAQLSQRAQGVIVGSALQQALEQGQSSEEFLRPLVEALAVQ
jgi:tryptophan synthase alpha chain